MAVKIFHASISENGTINGAKGDQTGKEVCVRDWYSKPWGMLIRPNDQSVVDKVCELAKELARCNLVGYAQGQRNTLYKAVELNGFDIMKYIRSGAKTNADCSSIVYCLYASVIPSMRMTGNAPTTSTSESFYKKHDFSVLKDSKYLKSDGYLQKGDLLNAAGKHIVLVLEDGKNVTRNGNPYSVPTGLLSWGRAGMTTSHIKWLQYELKSHGYQVSINGIFDKSADIALKMFQSDSKLEVDGICGPKTIKALINRR